MLSVVYILSFPWCIICGDLRVVLCFASLVSAGSFSVGFQFYYEMDDKPKEIYDNLKAEMLNYQYLSKKSIDKDVICKANQLCQTNACKSTQAKWKNLADICYRAPMTKEHLIAVILYTDFTELSADFSGSFRRKGPFEQEQQVRNRNDKYWWWSKKLQEVLWAYGNDGINDVM